MEKYLVNTNAQENGDHEVHKLTCVRLPNSENRKDLGFHNNCQAAVKEAKKYFYKSNGCYYCLPQCHTT